MVREVIDVDFHQAAERQLARFVVRADACESFVWQATEDDRCELAILGEDVGRDVGIELVVAQLVGERRLVEADNGWILLGDDAFHQMEEELDWIEMAGGGLER